jgi:hypothetical protein
MTEKPARAVKTKEKSVEQLRAAVAEDRAERFEEEQLRMEFLQRSDDGGTASLARKIHDSRNTEGLAMVQIR